ncbi:hypothetical protein DTL42_22380 [Bremerella cremea]|uniref:Uncharacterized protein n=1 Tax=Bremerella cremea TaxID=1031537 RepID=A0A368KMT5_9BACT|nr:hypothetical protein [Bremerella cremea]RCS41315.1 hypothetical protein DTL42_22380 [Bremerella cremea]
MSHDTLKTCFRKNPCKRDRSKRSWGRQYLEFNLSDSITPLHAFLVIFYAMWVVGGLLQTDLGRTGKPTSPHSQESGLAEVVEFESEGMAELQLFALTTTWVMPVVEVTAVQVVNDRTPVVSISSHTVSFLRGPPVA